MRNVLFPDLHFGHFGHRDGFVRADTQYPGGHVRFQPEYSRQCRIYGCDLRAGIEEERIRPRVVDGYLHDIEILRHVTRMYTGDVSRAMGSRMGDGRQGYEH